MLTALAVLRLTLTLAGGFEWDSNANRAELIANYMGEQPDVPQASFLFRTTAVGTLSWLRGVNLFRATASVGGKIFFSPDVQDQDVFVLAFAAEDRIRVARHFHLALVGDYYDAFQAEVGAMRDRDFRSGNFQARAYFVHAHGELSVTGGYRGFQYKPNDDFDFQAGQFALNDIVRLRFGANDDHEVDLTSWYHFERRYFGGYTQILDESEHDPTKMPPCSLGAEIRTYCLVSGSDLRDDWLHELGFETTYVGPLLVTLGYGMQLNTSNSFGQSLFRHIFTVKLAYRLPWQIYAAVKAQLYLTKYLDPVLLDPGINAQTFQTIDDENRNALIVDLERPVGRGLAIGARYSWFTNELAAQSTVRFERHVVYLGLTYRLGAR